MVQRAGMAVVAANGLAMLAGSALAAQPAAEPPAGPAAVEALPPAVRIGLRAETVRRQTPVIPIVVLVPDEASYVAAIAAWRPKGRFPVLIDDGTPLTRENLGRFIRAAREEWARPTPAAGVAGRPVARPADPLPPIKVVRWKSDQAWPADAAARRETIDTALRSAWAAGEGQTLVEALNAAQLAPPGLVAADANDPAWTAALALAAGHGQPIAWVRAPEGYPLNGTMPLSECDRLSKEITAAADAITGVRWGGLGDDLDALTVCLNAPTRVVYGAGDEPRLASNPAFPAKVGESFAATDLYGRHARGDRSDRWAWAGQVFGTSAEAAYRAMSGLFLQPRSAWLFHGYQSGPPWETFSPEQAARALTAEGWSVRLDGAPRQSATNFRDAASGAWATRPRERKPGESRGGSWADVIAVNTSGNADFFDLKPGRALAADVPILAHPALFLFVHSWSAQQPGDPATIAGRAFRHGAYAYVGSVHEPFLHAFQPTPRALLRMQAPAALGAAARLDNAPAWRINVLADPLITFGPPAARSDRPAPLEGAVALDDELKAQLAARDFAAAAGTLALLARDEDAVRLARAVLNDPAQKPTPELALAAIGPAFRRTDAETFAKLAELALARADEQPWVRDLVWHALWPTITQADAASVDLLTRAVRPDGAARDAEEAGRAVRRVRGADAERAFYDGLIARTKDAGVRKELERVRASAEK